MTNFAVFKNKFMKKKRLLLQMLFFDWANTQDNFLFK